MINHLMCVCVGRGGGGLLCVCVNFQEIWWNGVGEQV